ncbi:unnamed protein product, partial [Oikopleura dioica]
VRFIRREPQSHQKRTGQ